MDRYYFSHEGEDYVIIPLTKKSKAEIEKWEKSYGDEVRRYFEESKPDDWPNGLTGKKDIKHFHTKEQVEQLRNLPVR